MIFHLLYFSTDKTNNISRFFFIMKLLKKKKFFRYYVRTLYSQKYLEFIRTNVGYIYILNIHMNNLNGIETFFLNDQLDNDCDYFYSLDNP